MPTLARTRASCDRLPLASFRNSLDPSGPKHKVLLPLWRPNAESDVQANIFRGLRKWHKERLPQQAGLTLEASHSKPRIPVAPLPVIPPCDSPMPTRFHLLQPHGLKCSALFSEWVLCRSSRPSSTGMRTGRHGSSHLHNPEAEPFRSSGASMDEASPIGRLPLRSCSHVHAPSWTVDFYFYCRFVRPSRGDSCGCL